MYTYGMYENENQIDKIIKLYQRSSAQREIFHIFNALLLYTSVKYSMWMKKKIRELNEYILHNQVVMI